ncbi:MAG TPA: hypothetical protein VIF12_02985, partial [Micavibrio sp.]
MTTISNHKLPVNAKAFGNAIKSFHAATQSRTAGMEMERFILKPASAGYVLPDTALHDTFYKALHERIGDDTSVEAGAHMIEIKTGVHHDPQSLCVEMNSHLATCKEVAAECGLIVVPSSDLAGYSAETLVQNLVGRIDPVTDKVRRTHELPKAYIENGWGHIAKYSCSTTSIQLTHSVEDSDKLYRWAKIHSAMMPLYYAAFENRTRSADGSHTALATRR